VKNVSIVSELFNGEVTDEHTRAETRLSVFHSLRSESMNSSQEFLNLARAGDTAGGVQSSGNGSTGGAALFAVRRLSVGSLLGRLDSMIRCTSFRLTSASSKIRATREKYTPGRRRRRQRYSWRGNESENKPRSSETGVMGMQQVRGRNDCPSILLGEQIRKCHLNGSIGMKGSSRE
jgi:hypothetical protein